MNRNTLLFILFLVVLFQSAAAAPRRLSPDAFRKAFSSAFETGDGEAMDALASAHKDLVRPLMQTLLDDYSLAFARSGAAGAGRSLDLARALAERARRLSDDPFPALEVSLYASWSLAQHAVKAKADVLAAAGRTALKQGRYGEVAEPAQAAHELYKQIGDLYHQGEMCHVLGQAARRLADYASAEALHGRDLALAKEGGDRLGQARALIDLGDVCERQKNRKRAVELYSEALATVRVPEHWQEAGRALRQLGDVYVATGDFEQAYQSYIKALQYAEAAADPVLVAEYKDYLGYFHRRLGDPDMAIAHHRAALKRAALIPFWADRVTARARAFNHLGLCTLELAERAASAGDTAGARKLYREAAGYEEEALGLAERAADRWRQGYILRALALTHRELGRIVAHDEAPAEFRLSLKRADQALELARFMKEKEWEGLALHHKGAAEAMLGLRKDAFESYRKAVAIWEGIGDLQSMGYALRFTARDFYEPEGRLADARAAYEQARALFDKIWDQEAGTDTFFDCARLSAKEGARVEAAALYDEGIARLEKVRARAGLLEFKRSYMERAYDLYEEAALYMVENGFDIRAFTHAEAMKARVFLDQLAEGRVDLERGIDPDLKKKRDELEAALSAAQAGIVEAYKASPPDKGRIDSVKAECERLSSQIEVLARLIRLKNPVYASVRYPEPVTLPVLQESVLKPDEVLLEYFVSKGGVYAFFIGKEDYEVRRLSAAQKDLEKAVKTLLDNTEKSVLRHEPFSGAAARKVYDILISPFEAKIGTKTLILVPDGILTRLPFEMLVGGEGEETFFLLERHPVKYVQSASVLALLRTPYNGERPSDRFIGFGDPVYDYESYRAGRPEKEEGFKGPGRTLSEEMTRTRFAGAGGRLGRLKGSGDEIRAIEGIFRQVKRDEQGLLRLAAREASAKAEDMHEYGYIHFSAHGIVDPRFQAIVLSQIPGDKEDGFLTLGELMNCRYNAHLVVLSACRTGLGAMERGEGITGLMRAVMYAGSRAAVVSLWAVSDLGTKELMSRFYENMIRKGLPREEALRRAKLALLETSFRHPFFWSGFVMYGE